MQFEMLKTIQQCAALLLLLNLNTTLAQTPLPLPAHSHNDYEQPRPLFSALQLRFASIEADVFLVDGELRVGHEQDQLVQGRTLTSLYLEPLRLLVMRGAGQVYPETTRPLILLVDFKTDAEETYQALERALVPYERYLTRFNDGVVEPGAVTVIVSGNRPRDVMAAQRERLAAYEGRLADLTAGNVDPAFMPLISNDWSEVFDWRGGESMPEDQRQRLETFVSLAREQGVMLRFWNTPDTPPVWTVLKAAGVDLINADRIEALSEFLNR